MTAVWVEIVDAQGSTPRDIGTAMKVNSHGIKGTIGGGRLEFEAIKQARKILETQPKTDLFSTLPLGPNLGQCCGGSVTLRFTRNPCPVDRPDITRLKSTPARLPLTPLWLWGAGHVGRAFVEMSPAEAFEIVWVDTAADRFPENVPENVTCVPSADLARLAFRAPQNANHMIFTYSHDFDFKLCAALLQHKSASIGLIGSDTKRTRFFRRLRALGLDPSPITCPIGDKSLGKRPDQIAVGAISELLQKEAA